MRSCQAGRAGTGVRRVVLLPSSPRQMLLRNGRLPEPGFECPESHAATLIEIHQERNSASVGKLQPISVYPEKCGGYCNRPALFAIDERMILETGFPKAQQPPRSDRCNSPSEAAPAQIRVRRDPRDHASRRSARSASGERQEPRRVQGRMSL